jgi:hypothetical protein
MTPVAMNYMEIARWRFCSRQCLSEASIDQKHGIDRGLDRVRLVRRMVIADGRSDRKSTRLAKFRKAGLKWNKALVIILARSIDTALEYCRDSGQAAVVAKAFDGVIVGNGVRFRAREILLLAPPVCA